VDEEEPSEDSAAYDETDETDPISKISAIANLAIDKGDSYTFPEGCEYMLISGGKSYIPNKDLSADQLCKRLLKKIK
jgi:hypothetical protein